MATVHFTSALRRFYPELKAEFVPAASVAEMLRHLGQLYPGLPSYLIDEQNALRKHVNIFINGDMVRDRIHLSDPLADSDEVHIIQALSGG